ncbi:hypothetical protein BGX29_001124 [Mortierella sp. GBA35]|nr:hypothetical protein BGX29_001124 [Mortierella sp. GBA35]
MKIPFLLSISAIMALAVAQDSETLADPALDLITPEAPAEDIDAHHGHNNRPSSGFTAWPSPGLKGHKQRTKNTPGCYRLDGGAVGSFDGSADFQYAFYKDDRCKANILFAASSAPVKRIDPLIYPRSVGIFGEGGSTPEPKPKYMLITWSQPGFEGDSEKYKGTGCVNLDGSVFQSYQVERSYKFYPGAHCRGPVVLESNGGVSSHKKMNPPFSLY